MSITKRNQAEKGDKLTNFEKTIQESLGYLPLENENTKKWYGSKV